jgi:tetratricopeptide (TPR) repeat protein
MSAAIQIAGEAAPIQVRLPAVPWRDPHTVPPARLDEYIGMLEAACAENPESADLRTCLGMAYAMRFDAYKSMDALEAATRIDPRHFFAQLKYAELFYRLRGLERAEEETRKALDLAGNAWELSLARKQLSEIRRLRREGTQKPAWTKPLGRPALALALLTLLLCLVTLWR